MAFWKNDDLTAEEELAYNIRQLRDELKMTRELSLQFERRIIETIEKAMMSFKDALDKN
jgi:hypothetical protein